VEPSPSMKCTLCGGELLLKSFEPDAPVVEIDVAIYRCAKCGHEQSRQVTHDPYASHAKRR
jgi:DNA-directed RNA polymerase subunit RPC12/RpoP